MAFLERKPAISFLSFRRPLHISVTNSLNVTRNKKQWQNEREEKYEERNVMCRNDIQNKIIHLNVYHCHTKMKCIAIIINYIKKNRSIDLSTLWWLFKYYKFSFSSSFFNIIIIIFPLSFFSFLPSYVNVFRSYTFLLSWWFILLIIRLILSLINLWWDCYVAMYLLL